MKCLLSECFYRCGNGNGFTTHHQYLLVTTAACNVYLWMLLMIMGGIACIHRQQIVKAYSCSTPVSKILIWISQ